MQGHPCHVMLKTSIQKVLDCTSRGHEANLIGTHKLRKRQLFCKEGKSRHYRSHFLSELLLISGVAWVLAISVSKKLECFLILCVLN